MFIFKCSYPNTRLILKGSYITKKFIFQMLPEAFYLLKFLPKEIDLLKF